MTSTYKAVEVPAPGALRVVERQVSEPGAGQVRIRVEACGICHTDAATVTGTYPGLSIGKMNVVFLPGRSGNFGTGVMESESEREDSIFRGAGAFFGRTDREQLPPPISSMAEWTRS